MQHLTDEDVEEIGVSSCPDLSDPRRSDAPSRAFDRRRADPRGEEAAAGGSASGARCAPAPFVRAFRKRLTWGRSHTNVEDGQAAGTE